MSHYATLAGLEPAIESRLDSNYPTEKCPCLCLPSGAMPSSEALFRIIIHFHDLLFSLDMNYAKMNLMAITILQTQNHLEQKYMQLIAKKLQEQRVSYIFKVFTIIYLE